MPSIVAWRWEGEELFAIEPEPGGLLTDSSRECFQFLDEPHDSFAVFRGQSAEHAAAGETEGPGNGTDPRDMAKRFNIRNEYMELLSGTVINSTYMDLKFPFFGPLGSVTFEVPYQFYDINDPIMADIAGLGDVSLFALLRPWQSEGKTLTLLTGAKFWLPSADNLALRFIPDANTIAGVNVGTGKYRVAPTIGFVYGPQAILHRAAVSA